MAAYAQAQINFDIADDAVYVQEQVVDGLRDIVIDADPADPFNTNKAWLIQQKENLIADWTLEIEKNNAKIAELEKVNNLDKQHAIDNLKADIANQEAKNLVLENDVKAAKEELDAALGEPEETPAE